MQEMSESNRRYAEEFARGDLPSSPRKKLAVLTCMDVRLDVQRMLGLDLGDAHIIRNAGGSLTEDSVRSLLISSLLGTEEVVVIHHTDCRMRDVTEDELRTKAAQKTGAIPPFELGALPDLQQSVRATVAEIDESPWLIFERVWGFVYDVSTGLLDEVVGRKDP